MKISSQKMIDDLIKRYPALDAGPIANAVEEITACYHRKNKVLVCGNGGSAADSLHIVGELMKGFLLSRKINENMQEKIKKMFPDSSDYFIDNLQGALPAISLVNEVSLMTAYSNDAAPDLAFAQQVLGHGNSGDILIAISTSGNSKNVLFAAQIAKVKDMRVIALTGDQGGGLKALSDILVNVPSKETFIIQEYHLPIYHVLCAAVENEFFGPEA